MKIDINTHEPSGNVRGTAIMLETFNGKTKRIAHAYLPTGGKVDTVSLELPRKLTVAELRSVAAYMLAFADAVEKA